MKRYKRFMDGVKASDTLDRRLKALKEPKKKPAWAKYGAMAAALVLVFGLGWYGLNYLHTVVGQRMFMEAIEKERASQPDIALAGPGDVAEPGQQTLGSYDVTGDGMTAHYLLPYIEYTEAGNPNRYTVAADWDIPVEAFRRDMSREHIAYLLGGEDALSTHLDWDGYALSGWAAWYENGDFWGAYIQGYAGELDHFEFAVTANQLPPTCFEFPDVEEQNIHGLMVSAVGYDSTASTRQVSFMKDGYGYRFDLTGTDRELAEKRVSRLVRWVADDSGEWTKEAQALTVIGNGTYTCEVCGKSVPVGGIHFHLIPNGDGTYTCDSCGVTMLEGEKHYHCTTPGKGPGTAAAEPGYTCPTCGETVPAGMSHDCAMCDGYPVPHVCEVCGEAYPAGTEHQCELCRTLTCPDCGASYPAGTDHQCEICGYPLAPDTHVCEVCGQTISAGVEHSHQQEHHQEQHHGNHH